MCMISIHALREEGDAWLGCVGRRNRNFYPRPPRGGRHGVTFADGTDKQFLSTPSARRATVGTTATTTRRYHFYPRPPRGGRPARGYNVKEHRAISIHALREEGDKAKAASHLRWSISIHALREEGDVLSSALGKYPRQFLSTPSARRATRVPGRSQHHCPISIHALREEGDGVLDG